MAAISTGLARLGVEAGKSALLLMQAEVVSVAQIAFPMIMIAVIVSVRQTSPPTVQPSCSFPARSLPSEGSIGHMQSFLCNVNQTCRTNDSVVPEKETNAQMRFAAIQKLMTPVIKNKAKLESLESLEKSFQVIENVTKVLKDVTSVDALSKDIIIGNFFKNRSAFVDIVSRRFRLFSPKASTDLLNGRIRLSRFMKTGNNGSITEVICNRTSLQELISFDFNGTANELIRILCHHHYYSPELLIRQLGPEIKLGEIVRLFRDYASLVGESSLASDIENIAKVFDLFATLDIKKYFDDSLYYTISQWLGTLIHRQMKGINFHSIATSVKEMLSLLKISQPILSKIYGGKLDSLTVLRNASDHLLSLIDFLTGAARIDMKLSVKFGDIFDNPEVLEKEIFLHFPRSGATWSQILNGAMTFTGVSNLIQQWLLGKSARQILCESPGLFSLICMKSPETPSCVDYKVVRDAETQLCASESTRLIDLMGKNVNLSRLQTKFRSHAKPMTEPHEWLNFLRELKNLEKLMVLTDSLKPFTDLIHLLQPSLSVLEEILKSDTVDPKQLLAGIGKITDMVFKLESIPKSNTLVYQSSRIFIRGLALGFVKAEEFLKSLTLLMKEDSNIRDLLRTTVMPSNYSSILKKLYITDLLMYLAEANSTTITPLKLCRLSSSTSVKKETVSSCVTSMEKKLKIIKARFDKEIRKRFTDPMMPTLSSTKGLSPENWTDLMDKIVSGPDRIKLRMMEFVKTWYVTLGKLAVGNVTEKLSSVVYESIIIEVSSLAFEHFETMTATPAFWKELKPKILLYHKQIVFITEAVQTVLVELNKNDTLVLAIKNDPHLQLLVNRVVERFPVVIHLIPDLWKHHKTILDKIASPGMCIDYTLFDIIPDLKRDDKSLVQMSKDLCEIFTKLKTKNIHLTAVFKSIETKFSKVTAPNAKLAMRVVMTDLINAFNTLSTVYESMAAKFVEPLKDMVKTKISTLPKIQPPQIKSIVTVFQSVINVMDERYGGKIEWRKFKHYVNFLGQFLEMTKVWIHEMNSGRPEALLLKSPKLQRLYRTVLIGVPELVVKITPKVLITVPSNIEALLANKTRNFCSSFTLIDLLPLELRTPAVKNMSDAICAALPDVEGEKNRYISLFMNLYPTEKFLDQPVNISSLISSIQRVESDSKTVIGRTAEIFKNFIPKHIPSFTEDLGMFVKTWNASIHDKHLLDQILQTISSSLTRNVKVPNDAMKTMQEILKRFANYTKSAKFMTGGETFNSAASLVDLFNLHPYLLNGILNASINLLQNPKMAPEWDTTVEELCTDNETFAIIFGIDPLSAEGAKLKSLLCSLRSIKGEKFLLDLLTLIPSGSELLSSIMSNLTSPFSILSRIPKSVEDYKTIWNQLLHDLLKIRAKINFTNLNKTVLMAALGPSLQRLQALTPTSSVFSTILNYEKFFIPIIKKVIDNETANSTLDRLSSIMNLTAHLWFGGINISAEGFNATSDGMKLITLSKQLDPFLNSVKKTVKESPNKLLLLAMRLNTTEKSLFSVFCSDVNPSEILQPTEEFSGEQANRFLSIVCSLKMPHIIPIWIQNVTHIITGKNTSIPHLTKLDVAGILRNLTITPQILDRIIKGDSKSMAEWNKLLEILMTDKAFVKTAATQTFRLFAAYLTIIRNTSAGKSLTETVDAASLAVRFLSEIVKQSKFGNITLTDLTSKEFRDKLRAGMSEKEFAMLFNRALNVTKLQEWIRIGKVDVFLCRYGFSSLLTHKTAFNSSLDKFLCPATNERMKEALKIVFNIANLVENLTTKILAGPETYLLLQRSLLRIRILFGLNTTLSHKVIDELVNLANHFAKFNETHLTKLMLKSPKWWTAFAEIVLRLMNSSIPIARNEMAIILSAFNAAMKADPIPMNYSIFLPSAKLFQQFLESLKTKAFMIETQLFIRAPYLYFDLLKMSNPASIFCNPSDHRLALSPSNRSVLCTAAMDGNLVVFNFLRHFEYLNLYTSDRNKIIENLLSWTINFALHLSNSTEGLKSFEEKSLPSILRQFIDLGRKKSVSFSDVATLLNSTCGSFDILIGVFEHIGGRSFGLFRDQMTKYMNMATEFSKMMADVPGLVCSISDGKLDAAVATLSAAIDKGTKLVTREPDAKKTVSCASVLDLAYNINFFINKGKSVINEKIDKTRKCLKGATPVISNFAKRIANLKEQLSKVPALSKKIPDGLHTLLKMIPKSIVSRRTVSMTFKHFFNDFGFLEILAKAGSTSAHSLSSAELEVDVIALSKLSTEDLRGTLCDYSKFEGLIRISARGITAVRVSGLICSSESKIIEGISKAVKLGSLSLTMALIKEASMDDIIQFFNASVNMLSELKTFENFTNIFSEIEPRRWSEALKRIESLPFAIPTHRILKKAEVVRARVVSISKFSVYNLYFTTSEQIIHGMKGITNIREYLPTNFTLGHFFENKTQIREKLLDIGMNENEIDQMLHLNLSITEVQQLSEGKNISRILCDKMSKGKVEGVLFAKNCSELSGREKELKAIWRLFSVTSLIRTNLIKGFDRRLAKGGTSIHEVITTTSGLSSMDDFVKSMSQEISGKDSEDAYEEYEESLKNSSTLAAVGKAMCGSAEATGFNMNSVIGASVPVTMKRRRKRSVSSEMRSRNFCYDLLTSAGKSDSGKLFARFLQPLLFGKILVTPDVPWVRRIMGKANETYREMAAMKKMTTSMTKALDNFSSSKGAKLLSELRKVMRNPVLSSVMSASFGTSDLTKTINKLEALVHGKKVNHLRFYLEMMNNFTSCLSTNRMRFYANEDDPSYKLALLDHKDVYIYAAVNFMDAGLYKGQEAPKHITYKIRMSNVLSHQTNLLYHGAVPKVRTNFFSDLKYSQGFIQLQETIDRAIIEDQTGQNASTLPSAETRQFPQPCVKKDEFMATIGQHLIPVMILLSWLTILLTSVNDALMERENNLEQPLYVMGRNPAYRWLIWALQTMVFYFLMSFIMTLSLKYGGLLENVDAFIIFVSLMAFSFSLLMFGFFISSLFDRSSLALLVTVFVYLISYVPFALASGTTVTIPRAVFKVAIILPITPMSYMTQYWGSYQASGIPFTWSEFPHQLLDVSPLVCLVAFVIDGVVYFLLGWYIRNVFAGRKGISLPLYFFLTKRYWGIDENANSLSDLAARTTHPSFPDHPFNVYDKCSGKKGSTSSSRSSIGVAKVEVKLQNLTKKFKAASKPSVDNLSLDLRQDEVTVILGPNGAGKSTTISMLIGLLKPTSGSITIGGLDREKNYHALRRRIGFCPQHDIFFPDLSARKNLEYFASLKGIENKEERNAAVDKLLAHLRLQDVAKVPAKKLSGGQKRRLSVGIAFVGNSDLVVLDEPTSGIDPAARRTIWQLIANYKDMRTVVLCTHHIDEAEVVGDRLAILREGRLVAHDTPRGIRERFGCEYHISAKFGDNATGAAEVVESILQVTPHADIETKNGDLDLSVKPQASENFAMQKLFGSLEMFAARGIVTSIGVTFMALESAFLRIVRSTVPDDSAKNGRMAKTAQITESLKAQDLHKDDGIYEELGDFKEEEFPDVRYSTQPEKPSSCSQIAALLYKQSLHTRRHWLTYVVQILLPCLFLALTLGSSKLMPNFYDSPPLLMTPTTLGEKTMSFLKYPTPNDSSILRTLTGPGFGTACMTNAPQLRYSLECLARFKVLKNPKLSREELKKFAQASPCTCDTRVGQLRCPSNYSRGLPPKVLQLRSTDLVLMLQPNTTVSEFLKVEMSKFTTHQSIIWGGWEFGGANDSVTVWYNTQGLHALPAYFNALNNMLLRGFIISKKGTEIASNYGITVYAHPLPNSRAHYSAHQLSIKLMDTSLALGILFSVTMIAASLALRTLRESLSREKFLQQLYGVSPHLYWMLNFLWDFGMGLVTMILMCVLYVVIRVPAFSDGLNLPATILLTMSYLFATIPFCYLIGRTAKSVGRGFLISFLLLVFTGFFLPIIVYIKEMILLKEMKENDPHLERFFMLMPSASLMFGLTKMVKNQVIADVKEKAGIDSFVNPFGANMILPNLICLVIEGIFFFLLNYLFEIQVIKRLFHRIHLRYSLTMKKGRAARYTSTTADGKDVYGVHEEYQRITCDTTSDPLVMTCLSKNYFVSSKKIKAVSEVSFGIRKGECFSLLGANGAGKTSIFKCVTGEIPPSQGSVSVMGQQVGMDVHRLGGHIGYCPQSDPLDPYLTVNETLSMYARLRGVQEPSRSHQSKELQLALGIEEYGDVLVKHLSGGNRRKLSLAVALVGQPNLLLLDEPSSGVDAVSKRLIWRLLLKIRSEMGILLTSHSMEEIQAMSSRVAVLVNGKLCAVGTCPDLKDNYGLSYSLQFRANNYRARDVANLVLARFTGSKLKSRQGNLSEITIPISTTTISNIFQFADNLQENDDIDEYSVQHTSLEHILLEMTASQSGDAMEEHSDISSESSEIYDTIIYGSDAISSIKYETNC